MSDSKKLEKVVADLVRENNVDLKELIKPVVTKIAGEFTAAGLVPKDVEEQMLVTGVDNFTLATKLVNACQTSLTMFPDRNFPKFIEILKGHGGTMEMLVEEMESTFEQARKSGGGASGGGASGRGASGGSQAILGIKQLMNVKKELSSFKKKNWMDLGLQLGIGPDVLETVSTDHKGDGVDECLSEMLKHWLRQNYDDSDSKPPTWSNLADAVQGTGDKTVANAIRKN